MATKQEVIVAIAGYLHEVDPEEFSPEVSGDRAEQLAAGIADRLSSCEFIEFTDVAEVVEG